MPKFTQRASVIENPSTFPPLSWHYTATGLPGFEVLRLNLGFLREVGGCSDVFSPLLYSGKVTSTSSLSSTNEKFRGFEGLL